MKITFQASIEGAACIKYDGEGNCTVRLSVPASEIAQVTKLLAYREQLLSVQVEAQK